jgi:hypothetical protein
MPFLHSQVDPVVRVFNLIENLNELLTRVTLRQDYFIAFRVTYRTTDYVALI